MICFTLRPTKPENISGIYFLAVAAICFTIGNIRSQIPIDLYVPLPKALTVFKTKIYDFPYLIYDLTENVIHYLRPDP